LADALKQGAKSAAKSFVAKKSVPGFGSPKHGTDKTCTTATRKGQLLFVDLLRQHG
jgi:hypothetical protein